MLTFIHIYVGATVIFSNGLIALWLWLLDRWGRPISTLAGFGLLVARLSIVAQLLLGVALVGGGYVGSTAHYLPALAAAAAAWFAYSRSRAGARPLRPLAAGHLVACLCALGAYLLAQ